MEASAKTHQDTLGNDAPEVARDRHLSVVKEVGETAVINLVPFRNLGVQGPLRPEQAESTPPEAPADHLYD